MSATIRASAKAAVVSQQFIDIPVPSGTVAGDILVVSPYADGSGQVWSPNDVGIWTELEEGGTTDIGCWYMVVVGTPPATYRFNISGGVNLQVHGVAITINPDGQLIDSVQSTLNSNASNTTISTLAVTGSILDSALIAIFGTNNNRTVVTPPSTMTVAQVSDGSSSEFATYTELVPGAGSLVRTIVWSSVSTNQAIAAYFVFTPNAPTITEQPTPQVAIVSNGGQAVFTAAATASSGNITGIAVKKDGVVITNNSNYAIVTTGVGTSPNGTVELTVMVTDKAFDADVFTFEFTDVNGTSVSNGAAIAIFNGPIRTAKVGNIATFTCDYDTVANVGAFVRTRANKGSEATYGSFTTT